MKQMDKTKNYNLSLPSKDDPVDIEVLDENFKTLDEKLHEVKEYAVTGPKTSTDGDIPLFSGTGGRTLKGSGRSFPLKTTDISDGAVTHDKIADKAIANNNIQLGAISGGQVKDKALSPGKLEPSSTVNRALVTESASEGAKWGKVNISMISPSGTQDRVMVTTKNGSSLEVHWSQVFNWMIAEETIALDRLALGTELAECLAVYLKGQYMPVTHCKDSNNADMNNGWLVNWCRGTGWYIGGFGADCGGHPPYIGGNKTSWALCVIDGIKTEEGADGYNHRLQIAFDLVNSLVYMRRGWASNNTWAGSWTKVGGDEHTHGNLSVLDGISPEKISNWDSAYTHTSNENNPHGVTAAQIGLGNVNNTADITKPVSEPQIEYIRRNDITFAAKLLGYTEWNACGESNDVCTVLPGRAKIVVKSMSFDYITFSGDDGGFGWTGAVRIANNTGSTITVQLPYIVTGNAGVAEQGYNYIEVLNGYYIDVTGGRGSNPPIPNYSQTGNGTFDPITELAEKLK